MNKQYDMIKSGSSIKLRKSTGLTARQERLRMHKSLAKLNYKKNQIEAMRELTFLPYLITKEKFDLIPDNLMIRRFLVSGLLRIRVYRGVDRLRYGFPVE